MKKFPVLVLAVMSLTIVPARADSWWFGEKKPIDLNDARSIVKSLRGVSDGSDYGVYLSLNAGGTLYMMIKLQDGTEIRSSGDDLQEVLTNLQKKLESTTGKAQSAAEAVKAVLNQGKNSQ